MGGNYASGTASPGYARMRSVAYADRIGQMAVFKVGGDDPSHCERGLKQRAASMPDEAGRRGGESLLS